MSQLTCTAFCESSGHGIGVVIGTAPFCAGSCEDDCNGRECIRWPANCWTGHKVCCCGKFISIAFCTCLATDLLQHAEVRGSKQSEASRAVTM